MTKAYILQFEDVAHDIRVVTIQMPKGERYDFTPGQYAEIHIDGYDPRPFSIASAPRDDNTFDIHVRNSGQNISEKLCHDIKQGEPIHVSKAMGHLAFHDTGQAVVYMAGGTGITPFLAMMEANPTKPATIYWGMQSNHEFYIRPQRNGLAVHYCTEIYPVDAYLKDRQNSCHSGESRNLSDNNHKIPDQVRDDSLNEVIYLSGPPAMIFDSKAKLLAAGVEPSNIIHDEF